MQFYPLPGAAKLKDGGSSRRHVRKVLGSFLLALFCGTVVRGGEDSLFPIEMGKILFYPSVNFSYAHEDNVERANADDPLRPVIASSVQDILPMLRFEAPFRRSFTTLAYSAKFRDYGAGELKNASGTSHYLDFTQQYQLTPSLRLNLQDNFLRGITELRELDPGGELRFGVQPFRSNNAHAALSLEMGPIQSVEVAGSLSATRFDETGQSGLIPNFRSEGLLARYSVAIGPSNRLFLAADWQSASQGRRVVDIEPTDYRTHSVGLGLRRSAETGLTSELRVSYATIDFPEEGEEPFQGITAEGDLGIKLGATTHVALKLRRGPRPSFFNASSFYLNEMVEIGYSQEIGQRLRMLLRVSGQDNSYPEPVRVRVGSPDEEVYDQNPRDGVLDLYRYLVPSEGTRRRDHIRMGTVRFVYHVGRAMDLQLEYRRDRTRSNILAENEGAEYKIFNYDYESLTTSLIVGWQ